MKNLFSKDNFLFPSFDKKQKTQSVVVSVLLAVFFIASAFAFMNAMYCFADIVGCVVSGSPDVAIKDLLRSLPIILSLFMSIWALLLVHALFRNVSDEKRVKSLFKNGIALIAFGGITIVYIIIGLAVGKFSSLVEGSPTPLYPLDAMLYSLLFMAVGVAALLYRKKFQEKLPYVVPNRAPIVQKARVGYCFAIAIWMLVALFSFAAFWFGLFIIDFRHGYQAYSIALLLVYCVNAFFLIAWEFYYNELKEEARKQILLPLSIVALAVSVCVAAFYFIALGLNLDGPSNVGFGVLPVAFAASVNIATMLVVATPLIVSVVALIKGLLLRKEK